MKIISCTFNRDILIKPIDDRWYEIPHKFQIKLDLGSVVKYVDVDAGFLFDGRSGGPMVDYFAPNLGTQEEIKSWLPHDIGAYDSIGLSFDENNELLHYNLRENAGYGWWSANTIKFFVGVSEGYFGVPLPDSREYSNIEKIHLRNWDR